METFPKTWIEISKKRLLRNVHEITKPLQPKTQFMAVIKANAYGHDARSVASILAQDQYRPKNKLWFGVDSIEEGRGLMDVPGIKTSKLLVLGYTRESELPNIPKNIRLTVYNLETIQAMSRINREFTVHIKIETGTARQGITQKELFALSRLIKKAKNIKVEGVSSHFAGAESTPVTSFTQKQFSIFCDAVKMLQQLGYTELIRHIACSAAITQFPKSHLDLVRSGINLYGLQSITAKRSEIQLPNVKPVLTWKTIIAQIKSVKKGVSIGYSRSTRMKNDGSIAILPIGYFDGYDRGLGNAGAVLINGVRCNIIGRICMNMCMVQLPRAHTMRLENEVVLLGEQRSKTITADDLAAKLDTINYEIVTRINPLLPRIIV